MSNSPAFVKTTWAERARSSFEFSSAVEPLAATARLLDTLFFGVRTTCQGAAGVYAELYYESATRTLSACLLTFVQPERGFSGEEAVKLRQIPIQTPLHGPVELISAAAFNRSYWFTIALDLRAGAANDISLNAASARLHHDYSKDGSFDKLVILPSKLPDRARNLKISGQLLSGGKRFCPNCSGIGAFDEMAIPQADWDSGATGYGLYSCNVVSGREACAICGGSGGRYEKWYLDEHPELQGVAFIEGSGLESPAQATTRR